jgi:hypothetical protein
MKAIIAEETIGDVIHAIAVDQKQTRLLPLSPVGLRARQ